MENSREYPSRPICGVGVVAFRGDSMLLIRRGREPRRGEWSIPGGAVELGESVRAAAVREFREECGGEVELRDLVDVVDIFHRDDAGRLQYHYIVVDWWAEWRGGVLTPGEELMDARWVETTELDAYELRPWTREVLEKAAKMRRGLSS